MRSGSIVSSWEHQLSCELRIEASVEISEESGASVKAFV